jgi:hypothetical protein
VEIAPLTVILLALFTIGNDKRMRIAAAEKTNHRKYN